MKKKHSKAGLELIEAMREVLVSQDVMTVCPLCSSKVKVVGEGKPRRWWILGRDVVGDTSILHWKKPNKETIDAHIPVIELTKHYEPVKIDWEKVWKKYDGYWKDKDFYKQVQSLVEAQLAGGKE